MNYYVSDWIELLLKKIAETKKGPTHTSRWIFLATNCIYNCYQFVQKDKYNIDTEYWTWNHKGELITNNKVLIHWIDQCCEYFFPKIIVTYLGATLSINEYPNHSKIEFNTKLKIQMDKLKSYLDIYLTRRDNDNWKNTNIFNGSLPNGDNYYLETQNLSQNLSSLSYKYKWTPLKINTSEKKYLTPEWGTLNKGILLSTDRDALLQVVGQFYPSTQQIDSEIADVVNITSNLTDKQKMIAEFWAGGPGTVTPPGMWIVFTIIYLRSNNKNIHDEIKYYTLISYCLYESGICAWKLKRDYLQARPIQLIRYNYSDSNINTWNYDTNINGKAWLPYQTFDFVTPPFPDFVSGHSTFSSSCAKMLTYLTGSNYINLTNPVCNIEIISKLSPILETNNFCLSHVIIKPNSSEIIYEPKAPTTVVSLNWNTWTEMALSSGDSRLYGGIHIESSNKAGIYLGDKIADNIWNTYKTI